MKYIMLVCSVTALLQGCAGQKPNATAEAIALNHQYCQDLAKRITKHRGHPVKRTELRRRYDMECSESIVLPGTY